MAEADVNQLVLSFSEADNTETVTEVVEAVVEQPPQKKQKMGGGVISLGLDMNTGNQLTVDLPVHIVEKYHPDNGGKTVCYKDVDSAIADISQVKDDHEVKVIVIHQGRPTQLIIVFTKPMMDFTAGDQNWIATDADFPVLESLKNGTTTLTCFGCGEAVSLLLPVSIVAATDPDKQLDDIARRRMWLSVNKGVTPKEKTDGLCEKCEQEAQSFYGMAREQYFIDPDTQAAASEKTAEVKQTAESKKWKWKVKEVVYLHGLHSVQALMVEKLIICKDRYYLSPVYWFRKYICPKLGIPKATKYRTENLRVLRTYANGSFDVNTADAPAKSKPIKSKSIVKKYTNEVMKLGKTTTAHETSSSIKVEPKTSKGHLSRSALLAELRTNAAFEKELDPISWIEQTRSGTSRATQTIKDFGVPRRKRNKFGDVKEGTDSGKTYQFTVNLNEREFDIEATVTQLVNDAVEFNSGGSKPYLCGWSDCQHSFQYIPTLLTHIADSHMAQLAYLNKKKTTRPPRFCQWRGCNHAKSFRKLRLIIQHIREKHIKAYGQRASAIITLDILNNTYCNSRAKRWSRETVETCNYLFTTNQIVKAAQLGMVLPSGRHYQPTAATAVESGAIADADNEATTAAANLFTADWDDEQNAAAGLASLAANDYNVHRNEEVE